MKHHGGVKMGVPNKACDDGKDEDHVDWDGDPRDFACPLFSRARLRDRITTSELTEDAITTCKKHVGDPVHTCMHTEIVYKEQPPLGGEHRPLWPVYGEYKYLPPQRWVHSLEHGAAVFLYHPCADEIQIKKLKAVARSCLWRHIITPYRHLPLTKPLAIVTWGCKLTMSLLDRTAAEKFLKAHAINRKLPEWRMTQDGQFKEQLLHNAVELTKNDNIICPRRENLLQMDSEEFEEFEDLDDFEG